MSRYKPSTFSTVAKGTRFVEGRFTRRSSFRDWAAEETNHPREVIEAALAHVVGNKVEAAYRRSDLFERRRRLMTDWTLYLGVEPGREAVLGS